MSRCGSADLPRVPHIKVDSSKRLEEDYQLGQKLGEGTFGVVIEAQDIKEKTRWAVKKVSRDRNSNPSHNAKSWEREVHILKLVRHQNVVGVRVIYESDNHVYMIMELCDGGNLSAELNRRGHFPENEAQELMHQLGLSIDYLHRRNIVHRDVKLENLLIQYLSTSNPRITGAVGSVLGDTEATAEEQASNCMTTTKSLLPYRIKLTDFGLSIELKKSQGTMMEFCGTPLYMAPEIIVGKSYSRQCDVWSVGIIMHLLLTGTSPFRAHNEEDLYEEIREWEDTTIEQSTRLRDMRVSKDAIVVMRRLLHREPMHRFTSKEAMRQTWFGGDGEQEEAGTTTNILQLMKEYNRSKENGEHHQGLVPSNASGEASSSGGGAAAGRTSTNGSESLAPDGSSASNAPGGTAASPNVGKRSKQATAGAAQSSNPDRRRAGLAQNRRSYDAPVGNTTGRK